MNTLELPSGHLKIDPEGALFSSSVLHFFETSNRHFFAHRRIRTFFFFIIIIAVIKHRPVAVGDV